jgi:F0F1-type ATP synthase epsilon subunit
MARSNRSFTVSVLSESGVIYYGDCEVLTVPSMKDLITILPNHTPLITKLGKGSVTIGTGRNKQKLIDIKSGLLYVGDNEASVLVDL